MCLGVWERAGEFVNVRVSENDCVCFRVHVFVCERVCACDCVWECAHAVRLASGTRCFGRRV